MVGRKWAAQLPWPLEVALVRRVRGPALPGKFRKNKGEKTQIGGTSGAKEGLEYLAG